MLWPGNVQVPLPWLVANKFVCPLIATRTVAVGSSTPPDRGRGRVRRGEAVDAHRGGNRVDGQLVRGRIDDDLRSEVGSRYLNIVSSVGQRSEKIPCKGPSSIAIIDGRQIRLATDVNQHRPPQVVDGACQLGRGVAGRQAIDGHGQYHLVAKGSVNREVPKAAVVAIAIIGTSSSIANSTDPFD